MARILVTDIECSPNLADVWGLFNVNVSLNQLRDVTRVLCWAAKWHGDKRMFFSAEWTDGREGMIERIHGLLDEADAVVTYNGRKYDVPHLRREFLLAGLDPPSPFEEVDLYQTIRSKFNFVSGKMDHVSQQLGLPGKVKHAGHELWVKVMAGDPKAQALMAKYNKQDVVITDHLYDRLLPWLARHPNLGLYHGTDGCPRCGSEDLERRGYAHTALATYAQRRCRSCGSWSRHGKAEARADLRGTG